MQRMSKAVKRYGKQIIEEQEDKLNESLDGKEEQSSHWHEVDRVPERQMIQLRQTAWDKRTSEILGMKCSHTVSIKKFQEEDKQVSMFDLTPISNDLPHPKKLFRRKRPANKPYQKEKENHGIESHLRQLKGKQARCIREDGQYGQKQHSLDEEWKGHSDKTEIDSIQTALGLRSHYGTELINNSNMWMEGECNTKSIDEVIFRYQPFNIFNSPSNFGAKEE